MRNVREKQLKKCIILDGDEFRYIVNQIIDIPVEVNYTYDGIEIYPATDTNKEITDIETLLAKYFDVKEVTSLHIDDCDTIGVWIVYKD